MSRPYREPNKPLDLVIHALRKRRYDLGLTVPQLAERMNYEWKTIANWECGSREPGTKALRDWCRALNMTLTVTPKEKLYND